MAGRCVAVRKTQAISVEPRETTDHRWQVIEFEREIPGFGTGWKTACHQSGRFSICFLDFWKVCFRSRLCAGVGFGGALAAAWLAVADGPRGRWVGAHRTIQLAPDDRSAVCGYSAFTAAPA